MRRLMLHLLFASLIFATGCSRMPKYKVPVMSGSQDAAQQTAGALRAMYPPSYRMAQRVVIKAYDREFDFIAYLLVVRGGALRVQFLGEMGGTVMDLGMEGNRGRIFKKPDAIPADRLLLGALGDMVFLFDPYADENAYLVNKDSKDKTLVASPTDDVWFEYVYDGDKARPVTWRDARDGRLMREAKVAEYSVVKGGWGQAVPTRIELVNHRFNYSIKVQVLALKPGTGQTEQAP
jgi:hypothetical protein